MQRCLSLWWLLENALTHYFIFDFLIWASRRTHKKGLPLWLAATGAATLFVLRFQPPGVFLLELFGFLLFAGAVLQCSAADCAVPTAIIFTLGTLKEGLSAVLLAWASRQIESPTQGLAEQVFLSALSAILFIGALRVIQLRYVKLRQNQMASELLILLIPCVFLVCVVRFTLQLDSPDFAAYLSSAKWKTAFLLLLSGAAVLLFLMASALCKLTALHERESRSDFLEQQIIRQRTGLQRVQKQCLRYASLQHDIDNHLLVLSGLLREKKLPQAERYLRKLQSKSTLPGVSVFTGLPAVDVLLNEKLSEAKRQQIRVSYRGNRIPESFAVDEVDLCILAANILDNAIAACQRLPAEKRYLSFSVDARTGLLYVESLNPAAAGQTVRAGTGLNNIRRIVDCYHGAMETSLEAGVFRISVLLFASAAPPKLPFTQ